MPFLFGPLSRKKRFVRTIRVLARISGTEGGTALSGLSGSRARTMVAETAQICRTSRAAEKGAGRQENNGEVVDRSTAMNSSAVRFVTQHPRVTADSRSKRNRMTPHPTPVLLSSHHSTRRCSPNSPLYSTECLTRSLRLRRPISDTPACTSDCHRTCCAGTGTSDRRQTET
jgi:hypothetical protein